MFKVKTSGTRVYDVTADVAIIGADGMQIVQFVGEGSNTKNVAHLKSRIRRSYAADGVKVLGIDNVQVSEGYISGGATYEFDLERGTVIRALVEYCNEHDISFTYTEA